MSAYIIQPEYIGAVAWFAALRTERWGDAEAVAEILARENAESVGYRYGQTPDEAAGGLKEYVKDCQAATLKLQTVADKPSDIFGWARSIDYQSCERPEYHDSEASDILASVSFSAARKALEAAGVDIPWA